jgi:hypothetical protein
MGEFLSPDQPLAAATRSVGPSQIRTGQLRPAADEALSMLGKRGAKETAHEAEHRAELPARYGFTENEGRQPLKHLRKDEFAQPTRSRAEQHGQQRDDRKDNRPRVGLESVDILAPTSS